MPDPRRPVDKSEENAALFTPSVARLASSTARDWSYVDSWLATQFSGDRQVPPFERTPATLKWLLALANANESAMEERRLLARTDSNALQGLQQEDAIPASQRHPLQPLRDSLLGTIEHELPQEGKTALESLSAVASVAGTSPLPGSDVLGGMTVDAQAAIFSIEQMIARAESLESQIRSETTNIENLIHLLHGKEYKMPADLKKRNLDLQKTVKAMSANVSQPQKPSADLSSYGDHPASSYTTHDIIREEQDYRALLMQKSELESRIAAFRGLPSDPGLAQDELNALRRELEGVTSQRDAAFHGLVERSSPVRRK